MTAVVERLPTSSFAINAAREYGVSSDIAKNVNLEIGAGDIMFDPRAPDGYFPAGASALASILSFTKNEPKRICDFGCGHGRVMRWLRAAFPKADIWGGDVGAGGVEFCARTFGSKPVISGTDFNALPDFPPCDLVWLGSVCTHLREEDSRKLIARIVNDWLAPGGVAIISTHGRHVANVMKWKLIDYGVDTVQLKADFARSGYGYAPYPDTPTYGISLVDVGWWFRQIGGRADLPLAYVEQAWVHHHDLFIVLKV